MTNSGCAALAEGRMAERERQPDRQKEAARWRERERERERERKGFIAPHAMGCDIVCTPSHGIKLKTTN